MSRALDPIERKVYESGKDGDWWSLVIAYWLDINETRMDMIVEGTEIDGKRSLSGTVLGKKTSAAVAKETGSQVLPMKCRCGYDTLTPLARFHANFDAVAQNPDDDGLIQPASRISRIPSPGIFRFLQGVLLAQHRIEGIFLESLAKYSNVEVQRNVEPTSITHKPSGPENQSAYPVTVRIAQVGTETLSYPVAKPTSNGAVEVDGQNQKRKLNFIHEEPATKEVMRPMISRDGPHLATNTPLGQHFLSFAVINHCDARSWHFGELLKAGDLFAVVLFAGGVSKTDQIHRVHKSAAVLANVVIPLVQYHISGGGQQAIYDVADILTIHSAPGQQVEYSQNCYAPSMRSLVVTYCVCIAPRCPSS
ncbi:hypothetical protein HO173_008582 [Letharia columbiana]|uniref:Phenol hydroxylase-like C-terminal dimerisation domain-containing protein n=1 Tax=Letharia columbiana TaxID=112416 RepID=A0A8H6L2P2_9LECA|nr:uncharacterized protein HO173_008582 [Letharia columbiana]KAF6233291.1 hypothetical protein HO173_008582 [Letharia columbiana]